MTHAPSRASLVAIVVAASAALGIGPYVIGFAPHEDGYIIFRYAETLAVGHGLRPHPDLAPVEGYSCLAWVALLALACRCGASVPTASTAFGIAWGVVVLVLLVRLARRAGASRLGVALVLALAATNLSLQRLLSNGLETMMALAVVLALLDVLRGAPLTRARAAGVAVLSLLLWTTRPEAPVYLVLLALARHRRDRLELAAWAVGAALIALGFAARAAYFGQLWPSPFFVKMVMMTGTLDERVWKALRYGYQAIRAQPALFVLFLVGARHAVRHGGAAGREVLAVVLANALFVLAAGGDLPTFPYFRFLLPAMACAWLLAAPALERAGRIPCALALVAAQLVWYYPTQSSLEEDRPLFLWSEPGRLSDLRPGRFESPEVDLLSAVGRSFGRELPPDAWIAGRAAGKLPYHARRPFLDLLGLTSAELVPDSSDVARHVDACAGEIARRRPVVTSTLPEGLDDLAMLAPLDYALEGVLVRGDQADWPLSRIAREYGLLFRFAPRERAAPGALDVAELVGLDAAELVLRAGRGRVIALAADGARVEARTRDEVPAEWPVHAARDGLGGNLTPLEEDPEIVLDQGEFPARGAWTIPLAPGRYRLWLHLATADARPLERRVGGMVERTVVTTGGYERACLMWVPCGEVVVRPGAHGAHIELVSERWFPYLAALAFEPLEVR